MQVSIPHDLETTLRVDIAAIMGGSVRVYMPPLPETLLAGVDADIVIYPVGGDSSSAASDRYDVSVDVYAQDQQTCNDNANEVRAAICQLPLFISGAGVQYSASGAGIPYDNHDPRAPELYRRTFRAWVIMPAIKTIIV